MKILYLCHRVPYPPTKGEKIRAYYQLVHLARKHRIHLVCLADSPDDVRHARSLEDLCASVDVVLRPPWAARLWALAALAGRRSLSVAAFDSRALRDRVRRRLEEERPDLLLAYSGTMAQYVETARGAVRAVDFVDADSEKWRAYARRQPFPQSLLYGIEAERLGRFEARIASEFDASIFVSQAEADIVGRRVPGRTMTVSPMGVDLEVFRPPADEARSLEPVVVFTGVMSYFPNVDAVTHFARDVFPDVRREIPDARFLIVGREPSRAVRDLARLPGVTVTGSVPDVRPYLAQAAIAVAPFRIARGVQSKVLEAMASGLPIAGMRIAFQGLACGAEDGIRAAEDAPSLAREVRSLLLDPPLRADLGRRARRYVERHHRWEVIGAGLEAMLRGLVDSRTAAAPASPRP